jgi:hypothetical protein
MSGTKLNLIFDIFEGDQKITRYEYNNTDSISIGSGSSAILPLSGTAIKEIHALISIESNVVRLINPASDGSILCNDDIVTQPINLKTGDSIGIGNYTLKLTVTDLGFATEESTQMDDPSVESEPLQLQKSSTTAPAATGIGAGMEELYDKVDHFEAVEEDVFQFVIRSNTADTQTGSDPSKPHVLQVFQIYDRAIISHKIFEQGSSVHLGSKSRYRLRFATKPVAWVPKAFASFAWMMYPFTIAKDEFLVDFHAPDVLESDDFPLFQPNGGGFSCNLAKHWQGFVDTGEEQLSFGAALERGLFTTSEDGHSYELGEGSRIMIQRTGGKETYYAHMVPAPKNIPAGTGFKLDIPFLALLFLLGAFFGTSIALLHSGFLIPENDINPMDDRFAQMLLEEPPEPEEAPDANEDAGEGAKAKEEEGEVGKEDAVMKEAKGDKIEIDKKQKDKEIVDAAFGEMFGAVADDGQMEGMGAAALDAALEGGVGGLLGAKGIQMGAGGLGSRGSGLGGGGTANGLGGMGNKGSGRGSSGYGSGAGTYGKKSSRGLSRIGGQPIIMGALDKSLIDAVIKRNMNQIRYCYQRELTKNPSLGGKIVVKFTIAKDGSVSKASIKTSSMGNKTVENCISGRFMQFKFPEPKGGGIVIVSYPFIFSPG